VAIVAILHEGAYARQARGDHGRPTRHGLEEDEAEGFGAVHRGQCHHVGGTVICREEVVGNFARESHPGADAEARRLRFVTRPQIAVATDDEVGLRQPLYGFQ